MGRIITTFGLAVCCLAAAKSVSEAREPFARPTPRHSFAITSDTADAERAPQRSQSESCRRWRVIASRLGETYAGHRLRETVVARTCALTGLDSGEDELWQWPWRHGDIRAEPPPRLHGSIGAWVIRCGKAGKRHRCAMLHDMAAAFGNPTRAVAHFVIDTIGGRESVVMRVQVPGADLSRDRLEITVGAKRTSKTFLVCGKPGCLMEADVRLSSDAANLLWDGAPISATLLRDGRMETSWFISGLGFRGALNELARLRREEERTLATRR